MLEPKSRLLMYPFTYKHDYSLRVLTETQAYIKENGYEERIGELGWMYHSLLNLIPETQESFWSGHNFPWEESWEEIQVSFILCTFGLYKQAMVSLRIAMELGLLSVYWNLNDDGHVTVRNWLKSKQNTPYNTDVRNKLAKHKNFQLFRQRYDYETRLRQLGFLHDYVHTKGFKYSNAVGLLKSNFQTFEVEAFLNWFDAYKEVIEVLSMLHLAKYPLGTVKGDWELKFGIDIPSFGGLRSFEVERIERMLGMEVFAALREVAQQDTHVADVVAWINTLPDMTREQVDEQITDFDKFLIENQGLTDWLQEEQRKIDLAREHGVDVLAQQKRIEDLTAWAKKNGFEISKRERLTKSREGDASTSDEQ